MKCRLLLAIFALFMVGGTASGQGLFKKLIKKSNDGNKEAVLDTLAVTLPEGMTLYPCTVVDDKWNVSSEVSFAGYSDAQIFANVLLYTINQAESGKEHILRLDVDGKKASILMQLPSKFYPESKTYYKYANTFQVKGGTLSFHSTEMHLCSSNLFGDPKETLFESLQPEKKAKHRNYVNELAAENSIYLGNLFKFIKENTPKPVTHWQQIAEGNVVKGMNETECLLAVGKPLHIRQNDNQTKWMVNNDFVVIFENGVVIRIIK